MRNPLFPLAAATVALMALTLGSCNTSRKATTTGSTATKTATQTVTSDQLPTRVAAIQTAYQPWSTMQASSKVSLKGKTVSAQVRMLRGEALQISVRPLLGIEIARLVVARDSVFVVDKYHKQCSAEPLSSLVGDLPVTVEMMQNLLLGQGFLVGEGTFNQVDRSHLDATATDGLLRIAPASQPTQYNYAFTYDGDNHVTALQVTPTVGSTAGTTVKVDYSDISSTPAGDIAHQAQVNSTLKGKTLDFTLIYNDIDWNKDLTVDTTLPTNYKRTTLRGLLKSF